MEFSNLVNNVVARIDTTLSKSEVEMVIRNTFEAISASLELNETVSIPRFGKFKAVLRKPRNAVNPKTQEPIKVPAYVAPVFKAYDSLKTVIRAKAPLHFKKRGTK